MGPDVHQTITVQGVVQGVGFRPYVYGLASRLGLKGVVRNDSKGAVAVVARSTSDSVYARLIWSATLRRVL